MSLVHFWFCLGHMNHWVLSFLFIDLPSTVLCRWLIDSADSNEELKYVSTYIGSTKRGPWMPCIVEDRQSLPAPEGRARQQAPSYFCSESRQLCPSTWKRTPKQRRSDLSLVHKDFSCTLLGHHFTRSCYVYFFPSHGVFGTWDLRHAKKSDGISTTWGLEAVRTVGHYPPLTRMIWQCLHLHMLALLCLISVIQLSSRAVAKLWINSYLLVELLQTWGHTRTRSGGLDWFRIIGLTSLHTQKLEFFLLRLQSKVHRHADFELTIYRCSRWDWLWQLYSTLSYSHVLSLST